MKTLFKIIIRSVGGGFGSVLVYLVGDSLLDVLYFLLHGIPCGELAAIPVKIVLNLLFVFYWDDWQLLFFILGALVVLITQVWLVIKVYSQNRPQQTFILLRLVLLVVFCLGIGLEIHTELAIKKTYSEFCQAVSDQNYVLAYSYFSPEYRSQTGVKRFVKEVVEQAHSSYIDSCDGEFVGSIHHRMNRAALYPFLWSNTACYLFLGGPELIMVRIDGKWYFTGEHTWYMG